MNEAIVGATYRDVATWCSVAHPHVDSVLQGPSERDMSFLQGSALTALYPNLAAVAGVQPSQPDGRPAGQRWGVQAVRWTGDAYSCGVQWRWEFHHDRNALVSRSSPILDFLWASRAAVLRYPDTVLKIHPWSPRVLLQMVGE